MSAHSMDPASVWVALLLSAEAWRRDAARYTGWRRDWRLTKARALERRAIVLELNAR